MDRGNVRKDSEQQPAPESSFACDERPGCQCTAKFLLQTDWREPPGAFDKPAGSPHITYKGLPVFTTQQSYLAAMTERTTEMSARTLSNSLHQKAALLAKRVLIVNIRLIYTPDGWEGAAWGF